MKKFLTLALAAVMASGLLTSCVKYEYKKISKEANKALAEAQARVEDESSYEITKSVLEAEENYNTALDELRTKYEGKDKKLRQLEELAVLFVDLENFEPLADALKDKNRDIIKEISKNQWVCTNKKKEGFDATVVFGIDGDEITFVNYKGDIRFYYDELGNIVTEDDEMELFFDVDGKELKLQNMDGDEFTYTVATTKDLLIGEWTSTLSSNYNTNLYADGKITFGNKRYQSSSWNYEDDVLSTIFCENEYGISTRITSYYTYNESKGSLRMTRFTVEKASITNGVVGPYHFETPSSVTETLNRVLHKGPRNAGILFFQ